MRKGTLLIKTCLKHSCTIPQTGQISAPVWEKPKLTVVLVFITYSFLQCSRNLLITSPE